MRKFILTALAVFMILAIIGKFIDNDKGNEHERIYTKHDYSSSTSFVKEYAGGYTVEIDNIPSNDAAEAYALKDDGTATWMLIVNSGGQVEVASQKQGKWNAYENRIEVSIDGNSGLIKEYFERNSANEYFTNRQTGRYLKPN